MAKDEFHDVVQLMGLCFARRGFLELLQQNDLDDVLRREGLTLTDAQREKCEAILSNPAVMEAARLVWVAYDMESKAGLIPASPARSPWDP